MLQPTMFTKGENEFQDYYFFENEVAKELIQIIRNKSEKHWFGGYSNIIGDQFTIPIYTNENENLMLQSVCDWYNEGKPQVVSEEPKESYPVATHLSKSLMEIRNMFAEFPLKSAQRIQVYLDHPTVDNWDEAAHVMVTKKQTLWQIMHAEDSTFPRSGRSHDITGKLIKEWSRIPQPLEVLRAIKKHTILSKQTKN